VISCDIGTETAKRRVKLYEGLILWIKIWNKYHCRLLYNFADYKNYVPYM